MNYRTAMWTRFFAEDASAFRSIRLLVGVEPVDKAAVTRDVPAWRKCKGFVEQVKTDWAHEGGYKARKKCLMVAERL
jgi:hypothetical protein